MLRCVPSTPDTMLSQILSISVDTTNISLLSVFVNILSSSRPPSEHENLAKAPISHHSLKKHGKKGLGHMQQEAKKASSARSSDAKSDPIRRQTMEVPKAPRLPRKSSRSFRGHLWNAPKVPRLPHKSRLRC